MSKFAWQDHYEIGNDIVDGQHEHLFKLANHVYEAQDKSAMTHCALQLFRYMRKHFKDEERLMREFNYPQYAHHVEAHNLILARLTQISLRFKTDEFRVNDLKELMNDWLLTHILKEDKQIGTFIRQSSKAA